jgi:signal transduction histidine kinase
MNNTQTEILNPVPSVLVVDDNPRNLQLMSAMLKQEGYKLYITNSGENALTFLENTMPDLILLDVMMPGLSGFEVCRLIKKQPKYKDIPVIFLTAKNEVEDLVEGFEAGAVDYIVKPFHAKEVIVRVSTHIQLKQAREQMLEKTRELEEANRSLGLSKAIIEADAAQLSLLNAEKNKFFSIIAHDLRGPITGLAGLAEILNEELEQMPKEEVQTTIRILHDSSKQVVDLLYNLLEWSRVQMNSLTFEPVNLIIREIMIDVVRIFTNAITSKEQMISWNIDPELGVFADINMLKTILRNLISNAIKFTPHGGTITLSAKILLDTQVRIAISDSGIGMSPELVEKLFQIDQRVSRPGTDGESSNGLGLLLCSDLVKRQGGEIRVESREGEGSKFLFTLPGKLIQ